jgi:hypothetical protein
MVEQMGPVVKLTPLTALMAAAAPRARDCSSSFLGAMAVQE